MIHIDGGLGEGGGQILRSSLALSVATGQPFRIDRIRAARRKPGLLRQHLTALRAATAISDARVEGDTLGSSEVVFHPGPVRPGEYAFSIGSAGSTLLVLQTILVPLLLAREPSRVRLEGGTHNPFAPPFDFLVRSFLPELAKMGARVEAELILPGFYPAGGGCLEAVIHPLDQPRAYKLLERGEELTHAGRVTVAHLPLRIAEEERRAVITRLGWETDQVACVQVPDSPGPGNVIHLELRFRRVTCVVTGFGQKGVPAKRVGKRTAGEALQYLEADAPVGAHLADQLLLPLAFCGGGVFRTVEPSQHTLTNAEVLRTFLGDVVTIDELGESERVVHVGSPH